MRLAQQSTKQFPELDAGEYIARERRNIPIGTVGNVVHSAGPGSRGAGDCLQLNGPELKRPDSFRSPVFAEFCTPTPSPFTRPKLLPFRTQESENR